MNLKRCLSVLLALVMVLVLLPVASYADGTGYYTTLIDGESFESRMFPSDWTTSQQSNSYFWSVNMGLYGNGYTHTADGFNAYVAHNRYSEYERTYLILPSMDLSEYYGAKISCSFINPTWGSSYDVFGVCYRIRGGEWVELYHTLKSYANWTEWSGSLPKAAMTSSVEIAFYAKCVPGKSGYGVGLDDVTLEATNVARNVTYDSNGGTGTMTDPNNSYGYGCKVPTLANAFTPPSGMAFAGWNTKADGSGLYYAAGSTINLFGNTTLYAQWKNPVRYEIPTVNGNRATGSTTETLMDYAVVTDQDVWSETVSGGWYVADHDSTLLNPIRIEGNVKLVLCDTKTLKLPGGIVLQGDANSLTIYAGSTGSTIAGNGMLYAGTSDGMNASARTTGIGSTGISDDAEIGYDRVHLTVNGGRITAIGGPWSAAIGGAGNSAAGIITINGGEIYAAATNNGAGIGGGSSGGSGGAKDMKIYINGGTIYASGNNNGHAIGAGTSGIDVTVNLSPFEKVSDGSVVYKYYDREVALKQSNELVIVDPCMPHSMADGHCKFCNYIEATVTYDGNGATGGSAPTATSFTGASDDTIILPEAGTLVKEGGYSFVGWNTQADGEGRTYKAGGKFTVTESVKLYAKWQRNHTHSFSYTASGNTITASCTTGCDITQGLTLTVSAPDGTPVYDGTTSYPAKLNTDYNTTAFPGTYEIAYTKDGRVFDGVPTEAGTYDASVTVGEGDTAVTASVTYTIAQIDGLTVSLNGSSYTYDGNPHAITNTPTSNAISGTTQYLYSFEQYGIYKSDLSTYTKTAAGNYTVYVTAVNPKYNNLATTTATLSISPRAATISAHDKTKTYDNDPTTDPALTAAVFGAVEGDTLNYTLSRTEGQAVGYYNITVTLGSNPNYTISKSGATFEITPKAATISADAKTKTYDNDPTTDPALTATVTGVAEGDTLDYTLSREEGQDVDEYDITVTLGSNPNYTVTASGAKFTITPKAATITADAKSKVYDNDPTTDPALTATVTGVVDGETLNYTLSRAEGQNADEYDITVSLGSNPNYTVTTNGAKFTISPKAATVTADAKSKEYGEADPALTATVTGVLEGETLNYTLSRAEGQNADEYDITVTLGSNPNYTVTTNGAKFTITAATPTLADVSATAITYGETLSISTVSGTATNPHNGAAVAGAWAFTDGDTVPAVADSNTTEYSVTFTPTDTRNYVSVTTSAKLTVNKAAPAFVAPTAKELVYTGEAQALITAGEAMGGTMLYSLDGETFSETIPTATELGTYTVWYKVEGDANHLDSEPASLEAAIRLTICGSNDSSLALAFVEDGERLYRYDVRIRNIPENFNAVGLQVFLNYDNALLTLRRVENGAVEWTHYEKNNTLLFAWAGDTPVALVNDEVLFSLVFAASDDAAGAETALPFTVNAHGAVSAVSAAEDGKVVEYVAATVDGMIRFATPVWGDANDDGIITAADAAMILRAIVGLSELNLQGAFNADVDGDLEVTAQDAVLILRYLIGLIEQFPIEAMD